MYSVQPNGKKPVYKGEVLGHNILSVSEEF